MLDDRRHQASVRARGPFDLAVAKEVVRVAAAGRPVRRVDCELHALAADGVNARTATEPAHLTIQRRCVERAFQRQHVRRVAQHAPLLATLRTAARVEVVARPLVHGPRRARHRDEDRRGARRRDRDAGLVVDQVVRDIGLAGHRIAERVGALLAVQSAEATADRRLQLCRKALKRGDPGRAVVAHHADALRGLVVPHPRPPPVDDGLLNLGPAVFVAQQVGDQHRRAVDNAACFLVAALQVGLAALCGDATQERRRVDVLVKRDRAVVVGEPEHKAIRARDAEQLRQRLRSAELLVVESLLAAADRHERTSEPYRVPAVTIEMTGPPPTERSE